MSRGGVVMNGSLTLLMHTGILRVLAKVDNFRFGAVRTPSGITDLRRAWMA